MLCMKIAIKSYDLCPCTLHKGGTGTESRICSRDFALIFWPDEWDLRPMVCTYLRQSSVGAEQNKVIDIFLSIKLVFSGHACDC